MEANKRTLINWLGLFGVISLISYLAAIIFAPFAYPGYDWKSQAVSDLSAANSPSLTLWNQLNCLYGAGGVVCVMAVCVAVKGKLNKLIRLGIYVFAAMLWVSLIGYTCFPLSESGSNGTSFQDIMHIAVTGFVVALSVISLVLIMIGGYHKKSSLTLAVCASIALLFMLIGGIGSQSVPKEIFGIFERFSVFAAAGFTAVLGIFLFSDKFKEQGKTLQ